MNTYVGRRINLRGETIQMMEFLAWNNEDGTYDIEKNRYDGTTPKGVARSVILHYIVNEGKI